MRFSETIKLTAPQMPITRAHDAWLMDNDHPSYSWQAQAFGAGQLARTADRVRKGTVSASSLGGCQRYQQFVWMGMPQLPADPQNMMRMHNGTMVHLRWQMAGLTAGWLKRAEVPVPGKELGLSGTMDGLTPADDIVEIKSINARGFSAIRTFGPKFAHLMQMGAYMLSTGLKSGVFLYECKDDQEYREIWVNINDMPMDEVRTRAKDIWRKIHDKELFDPLDKCIEKTGFEYRSCPFREKCLSIYEWEQACG